MAKTRVEGVSGVLGGLITPPSVEVVDNTEGHAHIRHDEQGRVDDPSARPHRRIHARRGRPAGQKHMQPPKREKVTLRIDAALIARYREWSWEDRQQLGELVETAMRCFLERAQTSSEDPS